MKDLFYALVRSQNARPKIAENLQRENDELKEKVKQLQTERRQLREMTKRFARVVHVLEGENAQLRSRLAPVTRSRPLPLARRPPPTA